MCDDGGLREEGVGDPETGAREENGMQDGGEPAEQATTAAPDESLNGIAAIQYRLGVYARGREAVARILEAALDILIHEGIRAMTLRRIAAACGLRIGNVTYYFATKEELLRAVLDIVEAGYIEAITDLRSRTTESAEKRFALWVRFVLEDIQSERTTKLFSELWALANQNTFVSDCVNRIYERGRILLLEVIEELNPRLTAEEREVVAVFIQAATEGTTIFAGFGKPFLERMPWLTAIATENLTGLIKTIDSETIRQGVQAPLWRRV
jgi:AcrR family transcriptional regulator